MTIFWESLARLMLTMEMIGVDKNELKVQELLEDDRN